MATMTKELGGAAVRGAVHGSAGALEERSCQEKDWVSNRRSYAFAWGLPTAAILIAVLAPVSVRTLVWSAALVWMGAACLANARRCGRTHCCLTGPFFLLSALAVIAHGSGLLPLGPHGWAWLGGTVALGTALLWFVSEALGGRYMRRKAYGRGSHQPSRSHQISRGTIHYG